MERTSRIRVENKQIWQYKVVFDGAREREAIFQSWDEMLATPEPEIEPEIETEPVALKPGDTVIHQDGGIWEVVESWIDDLGVWVGVTLGGIWEVFSQDELILVT